MFYKKNLNDLCINQEIIFQKVILNILLKC